MRQNATVRDFFDLFQDAQVRNRVAIFHYGGHANSYQLLSEGATAPRAEPIVVQGHRCNVGNLTFSHDGRWIAPGRGMTHCGGGPCVLSTWSSRPGKGDCRVTWLRGTLAVCERATRIVSQAGSVRPFCDRRDQYPRHWSRLGLFEVPLTLSFPRAILVPTSPNNPLEDVTGHFAGGFRLITGHKGVLRGS